MPAGSKWLLDHEDILACSAMGSSPTASRQEFDPGMSLSFADGRQGSPDVPAMLGAVVRILSGFSAVEADHDDEIEQAEVAAVSMPCGGAGAAVRAALDADRNRFVSTWPQEEPPRWMQTWHGLRRDAPRQRLVTDARISGPLIAAGRAHAHVRTGIARQDGGGMRPSTAWSC